jgi:hypothetical protein
LHPISVQEQTIAEIVQSILQSPTLQVRHSLQELKLLACLQPMQSLVDALTMLLRAYPAATEEYVLENARRAFGDEVVTQLEAVAVLECRLLPLLSRPDNQRGQNVRR